MRPEQCPEARDGPQESMVKITDRVMALDMKQFEYELQVETSFTFHSILQQVKLCSSMGRLRENWHVSASSYRLDLCLIHCFQ